MYFYFSCNYDIVSLKFDLTLIYKDLPIPIIQRLDCGRFVSLPIKKGDYADLTIDVYVPSQLSIFTDSLFVMKAEFYNQAGETVAAGVTPVKITRPSKI